MENPPIAVFLALTGVQPTFPVCSIRARLAESDPKTSHRNNRSVARPPSMILDEKRHSALVRESVSTQFGTVDKPFTRNSYHSQSVHTMFVGILESLSDELLYVITFTIHIVMVFVKCFSYPPHDDRLRPTDFSHLAP